RRRARALHLDARARGHDLVGLLRRAAREGPRGGHARLRLRPLRRGLPAPVGLQRPRPGRRGDRADPARLRRRAAARRHPRVTRNGPAPPPSWYEETGGLTARTWRFGFSMLFAGYAAF